MGLDITAYRKLTKLDVLFDEDGEPVDHVTGEPVENYFRAWDNPDFPGRAEGLEHLAIYGYAEYEHVFSRSYVGYNRWRETLAKLAGYTPDDAWDGLVQAGAPFWELVNFADNEGAIGPVVAAKLLRDFEEFDERAKTIENDLFYQGYCSIRRGLELAADGGALEFH